MNIKEYEKLFGSYEEAYEEQVENSDVVISYATREECETLLEKYKNEERRQRELEESKWKKVRVTFELEADERYCYYNNKATLELYVNKYWSDKKIKDYVKENIWTSVCKINDECYW